MIWRKFGLDTVNILQELCGDKLSDLLLIAALSKIIQVTTIDRPPALAMGPPNSFAEVAPCDFHGYFRFHYCEIQEMIIHFRLPEVSVLCLFVCLF